MIPLAGNEQIGLTVLLSAAVPVLVTGLITVIKRIVEILANRKRDRAEAEKVEADATKTGAETSSVEADVFTKTLTGQGSVMDRLLAENQRAYKRADDATAAAETAEASARASRAAAEAAQEEARIAREEVATLREDMERFQEEQRIFEDQIEGYLIAHKVALPPWWRSHHRVEGSAGRT
jgi:hypothetical protein